MIIDRIKNKVISIKRRISPFPSIVKMPASGHYSSTHISAFSYGNAGDTLLPVVLRDLFSNTVGVKKWKNCNVHTFVDEKLVKSYNQSDLIVIGGGGLFLSDTMPNDVSGWQWNCSIDALTKINKPLVAFAIGYNRFRGQDDFKPIFTDHLNAFVDKAVFVGIRNHGSIEKLKPYLKTDELRNKLVYQPCMTTLIAKIYADYLQFDKKEDFVAFNCAFDRQSLRSSDDSYLKSIAKVALELSKLTSIKYYSHMPSDEKALPYFDELGIKYELVRLNNVKQIVECYSKPRLVIGMRGHAQMIPFGCLTPIVSIISHDKMQWFLDDIGHPNWGADVLDPDFEEKLLDASIQAYNTYESRIQNLKIVQDKLWKITLDNLDLISNTII